MDSEFEYFYKFKVTKIVDGDTVYGVVDLGFGISFYIKVRLWGIDTPEIRGIERPEGLKAKLFLAHLLESNEEDITIQTFKNRKGKYGRWLGILRIKDMEETVNDLLINKGYAKVYV